MSAFHAFTCPTGLEIFAPGLWEFDARLIHMHGPVMTRSRRLAAVRLPWRAAAATCEESLLLYISTSPNYEQHTDSTTQRHLHPHPQNHSGTFAAAEPAQTSNRYPGTPSHSFPPPHPPSGSHFPPTLSATSNSACPPHTFATHHLLL